MKTNSFKSLAILVFWGAAAGFAFGLPLASLKAFINGDKNENPPGLGSGSYEYGLIVSLFSVGEISGTIISAFHSKYRGDSHRIQQQLIAILHICGILGAFLFACSTKLVTAMIGRYITGIWTGGMNGVIRTFMMKRYAKRTSRLTTVFYGIGTSIILAMALGPFIGSAISHIHSHKVTDWIRFDLYRTPGWIILFLALIGFILLFIIDDPEKICNEEQQYLKETSEIKKDVQVSSEPKKVLYDDSPAARELNDMADIESIDSPNIQIDNSKYEKMNGKTYSQVNGKYTNVNGNGDISKQKEPKENQPLLKKSSDVTHSLPAVAFLLPFTAFIFNLGWSILEAMATPLLQDQVGMPVRKVGYVFLIGGFLTAVGMALVTLFAYKSEGKTRTPRVLEMKIVIVGLIGLAIGFFWLADWQSIGYDDPCVQYGCSFSDTDCSINHKYNCQSIDGCEWNRETSWGPCTKCAPVCRDKKHTLELYQIVIGLAFVNLFFPLGRLASGALWAQLARKGHFQQLFVACGSLARIVGPIISVAAYEAVNYRSYLIFITGAGLCFICITFLLLGRQSIIKI